MTKIWIALIGLGTVGGSVARILGDCRQRIASRAGVEIAIKVALVRDVKRYQGFDFPVTDDLNVILEDEEIEIVVELMGGVDDAFEIAKRVFNAKKALVTANKAMLAHHARDLLELSKNLPFAFEASVCGGIPIIEVLRDSLVANEIEGFEGIFNGTSNFILTQMFEKNQDFHKALQEAQHLGYAESDPSLDLNGGDAGHKLLILARLAYGIDVGLEEILIEGIEGVSLEDMYIADELGYVIKLVGLAIKDGESLELRLHLAWVSKQHPLAQVDGVKNAINLRGDCVGDLFMSGFGAGGNATASAVISDLVYVARMKGRSTSLPFPACVPHCPPFGFFGEAPHLFLKSKGDIFTQYYLRFVVRDDQGVLAELTAILAQSSISIEKILQRSFEGKAKIFLTTQAIHESRIDFAFEKIQALDFLLESPYKIRIL